VVLYLAVKKLPSFCYPSCYLLDSIILLHRCGEVFLSGTHRTAHLIPRRLMVPGRKCHLRYGFYHFIASLISWHVHMQRPPFQVFKYPFCNSIIALFVFETGTYGDHRNLHWTTKAVVWSETILSLTKYGHAN